MFPEVIETERLRLERFDRDAVDPTEAYGVFGTSETIEEETRYVTWSPHETVKETWDVLDRFEEQWEERENAVYAIFPRDEPSAVERFVGSAGLHVEWERKRAGLGVWLRKRYWGRGYAGERAAALLELAFDRLDLDVAFVERAEGNEKSKRAIEKYVDRFGGRYEGRLRNQLTDADGSVHDAHRYSIAAEEWADAVAEDRPRVEFR